MLFVVQRYGVEVAGGAEAACRELAWRMAARGHEVHALTSCAISYVDWANAYPEGDVEIDGVHVHRLAVARTRDSRFFGPLNGRAVWGRQPTPRFLQAEWMRLQGPDLPGLVPWIQERAAGFDVVIFVTYLYATTFDGLPVAAGLAPTILLPAAHDEPPFWVPLFDPVLRLPTAFAFLTEEEQALVERRSRVRRPSSVIGLGVDLDAAGDGQRFRAEFGIGDRPYLLYVGRLDPGKGSDELYDFFTTLKTRRSDDLALVVVGEPVKPFPPHPDVFTTGFVSEQAKVDAIGGCMALVMPSYFESFSIVLAEAWAQSKPALVNGRCAVLVGQAQRSEGAIPYEGYAQFEAAVDLLIEHPSLQSDLGFRGRRYVASRYHWDTVLAHLEHLSETAIHFSRQAIPPVAGVPILPVP
ncbi:MAG: glycosyltransferase family 4 protein [Acidimicrobiales bacterium]